MLLRRPLPYPDVFASADEYIDSILALVNRCELFQTLCGGVHILDFFTRDPSLFVKIVPEDWQSYLLSIPSSTLLDLLLRDDISKPRNDQPPESLFSYIRLIRKHTLIRGVQDEELNSVPQELPRHVKVGMIPKKIHEVSTFASYVSNLSDSFSPEKCITHIIDFGSGQNYLGRALVSPPYNKHVIALESRTVNIKGAKNMDVQARIAERELVMRNKKLFRKQELEKEIIAGGKVNEQAWRRIVRAQAKSDDSAEKKQTTKADFRPIKDLGIIHSSPEQGKGYVQYIQRRLSNGDLSDVFAQIAALESLNLDNSNTPSETQVSSPNLNPQINALALSLHSCGNLSHHSIRSLILNPRITAIAIVGCCYNLLTSSLPTLPSQSSKHPHLRPDFKAINAFFPDGETNCAIPSQRDEPDEHGFPMSERLRTYGEANEGITLNIMSRSMAVQAPANWAADDSEKYFERHFWRALLQRMFLDFGVVKKIYLNGQENDETSILDDQEYATQPIIVGTLNNSCFKSGFKGYVGGALQRLISRAKDEDLKARLVKMREEVTCEVIEMYEKEYNRKKKELSIVWSLMAFSAQVVESLIVVDRWQYLREHIGEGEGKIRDAWVEAIFDYKLSPRNLVVVGVK